MSDKWVHVDFGNGVSADIRESEARALGLWPPASEKVHKGAGEAKMRPQVENKMLGPVANKGGGS